MTLRFTLALAAAGCLAAQTGARFDAGVISGLPARNIGSAVLK